MKYKVTAVNHNIEMMKDKSAIIAFCLAISGGTTHYTKLM